MNINQRDFKGVWIPKEIYLSKELNWTDKIILIEIDSLDNEFHCVATNEYFADFIGIAPRNVSKSINKLINMGYVKVVSFDGRHRVLTTKSIEGGFKNQGSIDASIHLINNLINDLNIKEKEILKEKDNHYASAENPLLFKDEGTKPTDFPIYSEKKPIQEGFVEFWKLYPRKINKPLAEKKYIQALKKTTADNILKGLKHYIAEIEKFNTQEKYIKHPATWLYQECWVFEEEPKYQPKLDDKIRAKL